MPPDPQEHWQRLYRTKRPTEVSWYQREARVSLDLIQRVAPRRDSPIIDVGGGASVLVDALLDAGYEAVTVLDLAAAALEVARARLGARAERVQWIAANVLDASLPANAYDVWHDRAAFHFLTAAADRARYVTQVRSSVRPGGYVIVASFGPEGPTRCSGLDVVRYGPEALHAEFGEGFGLVEHLEEDHYTPAGEAQPFVYCLCRRDGGHGSTWQPRP